MAYLISRKMVRELKAMDGSNLLVEQNQKHMRLGVLSKAAPNVFRPIPKFKQDLIKELHLSISRLARKKIE